MKLPANANPLAIAFLNTNLVNSIGSYIWIHAYISGN